MKVPLYERQAGLTAETPDALGPMGNMATMAGVEAAGRPGRSLQEAGLALTQIGGEMRRHLQRAQQVSELADAHLAAKEQLLTLENLVKEYDPEIRADAFKQGAQDWFENYHQNLKDPEVQAAFKNHWATWYPAGLQKVENKAQEQRILNYAGNLEANWQKSLDMYVNATDELERVRHKGDAWGMLNGGVAALLLHPAQAEKMKQRWDKTVALGQLNQDMLKDAPGTLEALRKPRAYGLNDTERAGAISHVNSEMHRFQETNAIEVDKAFEAGTLTFEGLEQMRNGRAINLSTYRFYEGALRAGTDFKAVTDMDLYVPLFKQAHDGKMDAESVYRGLSAGRLKKDDAKYLIALNERRGQPDDEMAFLKDPALKMSFNTALHEIQGRLRPLDQNKFERKMEEIKRAGGMGAPPRQEAMFENQATVSFINACKEASRAGTLTPTWMLQKAVELSKPFEVEGARGILRAPARGVPAATGGQGMGSPGGAPLFNPSQGPAKRQQENW